MSDSLQSVVHTIQPVIPSLLHQPANHLNLFSSIPPVSNAILIHPKHIYKTASDTFRVQVGKGSKQERNGKFSRNCANEIDSFWLCEMALIVIDGPLSLKDIVRVGNYRAMLQRGLVTSEEDFSLKLVAQAESLKLRNLIKSDECERIVTCFRTIFPPEKLSLLSAHNCIFRCEDGVEDNSKQINKDMKDRDEEQSLSVPNEKKNEVKIKRKRRKLGNKCPPFLMNHPLRYSFRETSPYSSPSLFPPQCLSPLQLEKINNEAEKEREKNESS
eukprot:CAMPEP_0182416378 /NCGR_PEP_ID=MMETSP1167-20130531/657_1 /TAXON_ID=2988 /ORGANISM="Mallomonas Sp, Strain CCMP3275" /LENGTH=271 /DNA_ID=CAMNT_0024589083 /DNA_START=668 /DNA_END=1483 /DNA_ORIENTATION=+